MPDLLGFQRDFAAALRDRARTDALAPRLAGAPDAVDRRMAIYRANMVAAADKALSAAYPVIRQVVGEAFFHGLAREYQRGTPSTSGDLTTFGAGFDAFMAAFEHVQDMPWLPDLARLEWAAHRAYGAADAPDWEPAALAAIPPERQDAIRFQWSPGSRSCDPTFRSCASGRSTSPASMARSRWTGHARKRRWSPATALPSR